MHDKYEAGLLTSALWPSQNSSLYGVLFSGYLTWLITHNGVVLSVGRCNDTVLVLWLCCMFVAMLCVFRVGRGASRLQAESGSRKPVFYINIKTERGTVPLLTISLVMRFYERWLLSARYSSVVSFFMFYYAFVFTLFYSPKPYIAEQNHLAMKQDKTLWFLSFRVKFMNIPPLWLL